ncbi:hypothetical protein B7R22_17025 [Subtercola boreus]|uniref:Uncharacterized protein n=1 Tax=Subtercola boreus TaxID=120213 RepID=A0A3E0VRW2_9MICO|nr:hypothetical protein [Subtercola boreus]RFA12133.1 hypothetical protein B7R22_17025 [Subtercola boreus]
MSPDELKKVVTKIQLGDSRQVDANSLKEWWDNIGGLDFADAIAAVTMHRQESTVYLLAAHVVGNVRRIRQDRAERASAPSVTDDSKRSWRGGQTAPKPDNFEAMVAAANDPAKFEEQCAIYNRQLADAGFEIDRSYGVA